VKFPVLFVCICVLNNCHRVATHLQLNIYHILSLTAQHPHCQECMFSTLETTTNPLNFQLLNYHPVTHFSTFYILSPQKLDGNSKPLFGEFFQELSSITPATLWSRSEGFYN
jgi:hypothetical protein